MRSSGRGPLPIGLVSFIKGKDSKHLCHSVREKAVSKHEGTKHEGSHPQATERDFRSQPN